jgi:hypothetical protein
MTSGNKVFWEMFFRILRRAFKVSFLIVSAKRSSVQWLFFVILEKPVMLSSQSFITSLFYLQLSRYRQNRWSSRRIRKRVVLKNGECNVVQSNVAKRRRRYLADIFTTMVRHHLLLRNKQKVSTQNQKKERSL